MKNGKKPTKKQLITMKDAGLNPSDWLISKNLPGELHLIHRYNNQTKTLWV